MHAPIQRISHLHLVSQQQRVFADGHISAVRLGCVGGHGNLVAGVQPAMAAVPGHCTPGRGRPAIPQR
jgi:hypothetical protein